VVDDEASMRELLEIVLTNAGYDVASSGTIDGACEMLREKPFDVVITDLRMGANRSAGMELLSWMKENVPTTPAIMITAHASVETAIEAMKRGAADYIMKPFTNDEMRLLVKRAIEQRNLLRENAALRKDQAARGKIENIIGKSVAIQEVMAMIRPLRAFTSSMLLRILS
jgi:two-component system response regulator PilR (NtrC family)